MSTQEETISVEVAYARAHKCELVQLRLARGCTLRLALEASGLLQKHPEIDIAVARFGVFGKLAKLDAELRDHDRVEIYRPLIADPKEVRRRRAEEGKAMKKGGGEVQP